MRVSIVVKFLGVLTFVISIWMFVPLIYAAANRGDDVVPFAKSIALGLATAASLYFFGKNADMAKMGMREAMAAVALSWVAASAVSALPYWLHGSVPTYTDGFFESMSGYTTTGSTILSNIEWVPKGLLLWRGLTHWLGGMGIIVLTLTMMPLVGVGGFQLYSAEVPGLVHERITPRVRQTAAVLWLIYLGLTVFLTFLLLLGGMTFFDAATHAMGTISTGGFSPHNNSLAYYGSSYIDWTITFFMFLSGANFALHFQAIRGKSLAAFWRDAEFRFYTACVSVLCLLIAIALAWNGTYRSFLESLRFGSFQVVSLLTTTGFVSANYETWPYFPKSILFLCLFLGGCAGSTSGGIKQIRLLVLLRHVCRQFTRALAPRAVLPLKVGDRAIELDVLSSCLAFFGLYVMLFAGGIFFVSLYEPDLFTAISGVAATLGNAGPGFGRLGAAGDFSSQAMPAKWIYAFLMLCGRLELYTVLILFTRAYWDEGVILGNG